MEKCINTIFVIKINVCLLSSLHILYLKFVIRFNMEFLSLVLFIRLVCECNTKQLCVISDWTLENPGNIFQSLVQQPCINSLSDAAIFCFTEYNFRPDVLSDNHKLWKLPNIWLIGQIGKSMLARYLLHPYFIPSMLSINKIARHAST